MTLSLPRSVTATAGLIAAGWLLSACSNGATPEAVLGTAGAEPSAIALETSNQSVTVTNNAGKPIEDVRVAIQPVGTVPPFTFMLRRMENAERREISLAQFRSNDGTVFSPRFSKARSVTATATDIVGKKHEVTRDWMK